MKIRKFILVSGLGCGHKLRSTRGSAIEIGGKLTKKENRLLSQRLSPEFYFHATPPPCCKITEYINATFPNVIAKIQKHENMCYKDQDKNRQITLQVTLTVKTKLLANIL